MPNRNQGVRDEGESRTQEEILADFRKVDNPKRLKLRIPFRIGPQRDAFLKKQAKLKKELLAKIKKAEEFQKRKKRVVGDLVIPGYNIK